MKSILTPEDGRELDVTNPREELLSDTLELALGILTIAIRYRNHFINWRGWTVPTPVCKVSKDGFGDMPRRMRKGQTVSMG